MEKCSCPLTDAPDFICPKWNWKMYPKSHAICRGEHGGEMYNQYSQNWALAGAKKLRESKPKDHKFIWAYGITTVPSRKDNLLKTTIESLKLAGWGEPWLFIDGENYNQAESWKESFPEISGLTIHQPKLNAYGNWITSLWELYIRNPHAQYYAIFQDDFVAYRNLRTYLESLEYPINGYWNLLTFPQNQNKIPKDMIGWFKSNQQGLGAVALVFNKKMVLTLLASEHMVGRPCGDAHRAVKSIDGGVVTALSQKAGYIEYVHNPSLVQHIGKVSALGNAQHPKAPSFRGEEYDARLLSDKLAESLRTQPRRLESAKMRARGNGLGDNVAKALGFIGITEDRVSKWLGRPCACAERRQKLNQLGSWAKRVLTGKTEDAKNHLEKIIEDTDKDARCE